MTNKRKRTELGRELAKLRIDFSETASEMADKLGMSSSNLFNVETGAVSVSYDLVVKVKEAYGKDLEEMFINGGGLSKVVLELDELSIEDRAIALALWCKCNNIDPPVTGPTLTEAVEVIDVAAPPKKKPTYKPPPLPEDIGFLTDDDLEGLDDI